MIDDLKLNDPKLLELALTHSSYSKDNPGAANNERLEFYGDAVLKLVFSKYLFNRYPKADEGLLTKYRARLISDDLLSRLGYKLELEPKLIIGSSMQNRKLPKSIIGDAVEAMIGAIYIDLGFEAAEKFILELWSDLIDTAIKESTEIDYKSVLQEKIQKAHKEHPNYKTISEEGPDHSKTFEVGVYIGDKLLGTAKGHSKKLASQAAAKVALDSNLRE